MIIVRSERRLPPTILKNELHQVTRMRETRIISRSRPIRAGTAAALGRSTVPFYREVALASTLRALIFVRVLRRASVWASVGKCLEASLTGEVNRDVW